MSQKRPWFLKLAHPYVARRLRRQFSDVRLLGAEELRNHLRTEPLIFACNHVAWWDPLLLVHLDSYLGSDGYCLMDKANLEELPFFRWVGALPLDRSSNSRAYRDLRSATHILDVPGKILAIFPQGQQRPAHLSLDFKPGVATLARITRVPVIPLAIRYDYQEGPRQIVHLSAGAPVRYSTPNDTRETFMTELERGVALQLARIDEELSSSSQDFDSLVHTRPRKLPNERIPLPATALRALTGGAHHE